MSSPREGVSKDALINYLLTAATDIREREERVADVHRRSKKSRAATAEELAELSAQQFHSMRHLANVFVMLATHLEGSSEPVKPPPRVRRRDRLRAALKGSIGPLLRS